MREVYKVSRIPGAQRNTWRISMQHSLDEDLIPNGTLGTARTALTDGFNYVDFDNGISTKVLRAEIRYLQNKVNMI